MDIEEYMRLRHRKNNSNLDNVQKRKVKYLKNLITRLLISIIIIISTCIYMKMDSNNFLVVEKYLFQENFRFTWFNNWYQENFGTIIPSVDNTSDVLVFSSDELKLKEYVEYEEGVKISLDKNTPVSALVGGIVVFIGEKDFYENTIIIQGNDGIDYWYGGVSNISVNLYDYIETDTLIGDTSNNYLYLVLQKDGNFIKYEEIL